MQNSLSDINVSTRIIIGILLVLSLFFADSIYLITFLAILFLIFCILCGKSVKHYVYLLKKLKFLLLFIFLIYIIVFRDIISSILFFYKLLLVVCIIKQFSFGVNFQSLNNGIITLLKPLQRFDFNLSNLSYGITIRIYFIWYYINLSNININNDKFGKLSLKYYILPKMFLCISKINELDSGLRLKLYRPKYESNNIKSNLFLFVFILLFFMIVFKEVIL